MPFLLRRFFLLTGLLAACLSAHSLAHAESGEPLLAPKESYRWQPTLAPQGPVLIVVNLSSQELYVYRNGIRIGASRVSTGRPGHETPVGVYTILQKEREHFSNKYDNAPMPYMERLTWSGVAIHAGILPGHPASHGCIRLPTEFAEILFGVTDPETTMVVIDRHLDPLFVRSSTSELGPEVGFDGRMSALHYWNPAVSAQGPLSIVLSTHDGQVVVVRNGREIGRAQASFTQPHAGTRVFMLLDGIENVPSPVVEGRPARRWVELDADSAGERNGPVLGSDDPPRIPPDFAIKVYDEMVPGTIVVVTDEPLVAGSPTEPLIQSDEK